MGDTTIVLPEQSNDFVSAALVQLTLRLQQVTREPDHGFLGGEGGYGCQYENDVFMMHPFCWCERGDCPWCRSCECPNEYEYRSPAGEVITEEQFYRLGFDDYPDGRKYDAMNFVGQECRNCVDKPKSEPHFRYKPTGAEVRWYKYIGRGMKIEGDFPADFLDVCLKSVTDV